MSKTDDVILDEHHEAGINYPNQIERPAQKIVQKKIKHLPDFQDEDFEFYYLEEDAPY